MAATVPGVDAEGNITGTTNTLPWAPIPAILKTQLTQMAAAGQLDGVPPQLLSYIMQAESGPSYEGGGWNGIAGGWFGLEAPDIAGGQATIVSQSTFEQQAQAAAGIFATGLTKSGGNAVQAENYYQTGDPSKSANGAGIVTGYLQGAGQTVLHTQLSPSAAIAGDAGTVANAAGLSGLSGLESGVDDILNDITSAAWWERVGMGALGVVLFGIGLAGFLSTTKPGQEAKTATAPLVKDAAMAAVVA